MQDKADDDDWIEVQAKNDEIWDRKDTLIGKYISLQTDVPPHKSKLYTLKTPEGNVGVWGSTVLDSRFENVPIGSVVKIEPRGEAISKAGKAYQDFGMYHKLPENVKLNDPFEQEMPPDFGLEGDEEQP